VTIVNVELLQSCSSQPDREGQDRLEILTTLLDGPSFDPIFRRDVIDVPPDHRVYRWVCTVADCQRPLSGSTSLCGEHEIQWSRARARGVGKAAFLSAATGLPRFVRVEDTPCRICPDRPIAQSELLLCRSHQMRWFRYQQSVGEAAQFDEWLTSQSPLPGYGTCVVAVCLSRAHAPLGLCTRHDARYERMVAQARRRRRCAGGIATSGPASRCRSTTPTAGIPLGAPPRRYRAAAGSTCSGCGRCGPSSSGDCRPARRACRNAGSSVDPFGVTTCRDLGWITGRLAVTSAASAKPGARRDPTQLRLAYYTPADTRDAGFIRPTTSIRFPHRGSFDSLYPATWLWIWSGSPDRPAAVAGCPAPALSTQPAGPRNGRLPGQRSPAGTTALLTAAPAGASPTNVTANAAACRRGENASMDRPASSPDDLPGWFNAVRKLLRDASDDGA
jgi:hypothetical protein